jgi:hypothetical protein
MRLQPTSHPASAHGNFTPTLSQQPPESHVGVPAKLNETHPQPLVHAETPTDWIWRGIVAPGRVTQLTGEPRVGKTRFMVALLGHRQHGLPFLGLPTRRGVTIVATDAPARLWRWSLQDAERGGSPIFLIEPSGIPPTDADCDCLVKCALAAQQRSGAALVIIDRLAAFAPAADPAAPPPIDRVAPLTAAGLAVLLIDRPSKIIPAPGADIHVELCRLSLTNPSSGRRRLIAYKGFAETPASLRFAMDYTWKLARLLPERTRPAVPAHWPILKQLLEQSPGKLTRNELHARWPAVPRRPNKATLWRWLESAWAQGQIDREGTGTTNDSFRYSLAAAATTETSAVVKTQARPE